MDTQPVLETERLILRPFTPEDAPVVQRLAGDDAIYSTTLNIPHPYEDGLAEQWIGTHTGEFEKGRSATFAVVRRGDGLLIGAVGLTIRREHDRAEIGYWIGRPYWNNGYCSEAARAVLRYGFRTLGLNRIHANHLKRNPASGRVMQKIGIRYEGCRREHIVKDGRTEDLEEYGLLRREFETRDGSE